jgi:hypothetical protein
VGPRQGGLLRAVERREALEATGRRRGRQQHRRGRRGAAGVGHGAAPAEDRRPAGDEGGGS